MPIKTNLKDLTPRRDRFAKKVKLLSGGYSCPEAFPNGEITVFPWDYNIDSWLQEGRTGKQAETLLFDLLKKVVDLNGCPLERFVAGDVLMLLMFSRSIQNDCKIEYVSICPHCANEELNEITLPDELRPVGVKAVDYKGYDEVTLPDIKDVLTIAPLTVGEEKSILTRTAESKKLATDTTARIVSAIKKINGEDVGSMVELLQWFNAIPPKDVKFVEDRVNEVTPHLDLDLPHKCDRCQSMYEWPLIVGPEFFRTGRVGQLTAQVEENL